MPFSTWQACSTDDSHRLGNGSCHADRPRLVHLWGRLLHRSVLGTPRASKSALETLRKYLAVQARWAGKSSRQQCCCLGSFRVLSGTHVSFCGPFPSVCARCLIVLHPVRPNGCFPRSHQDGNVAHYGFYRSFGFVLFRFVFSPDRVNKLLRPAHGSLNTQWIEGEMYVSTYIHICVGCHTHTHTHTGRHYSTVSALRAHEEKVKTRFLTPPPLGSRASAFRGPESNLVHQSSNATTCSYYHRSRRQHHSGCLSRMHVCWPGRALQERY